MFIDVTEIRNSSGLTIDLDTEFNLKKLEFSDGVLSFDEPLTVKLTIKNIEGLFELKGTIKGDTKLICSRCLEEYPYHLESSLNERFCTFSEVSSLEEKGIDMEDVHIFEGSRIELDDLLREEVLLSLPMKPVCNEDCQGLCSSCGINLNTAKCSCDNTSIDPRLEVLKNLLK